MSKAANSQLPQVPEWTNTAPDKIAEVEQLVWVEANGWDDITASLTCLEKNDGQWETARPAIPVTIGRTGMIPGNGWLTYPESYPHKQEGDGKTPVGIYPILFAYGYAPIEEVPAMKVPYLPVTKQMRCVDDPKSKHYNKLVDLDEIAHPYWDSAEEMYRDDDLYKWGLVMDYNFTQVKQGAGSCVFVHLWRSPESPTAGCTAMTEENFLSLLKWLDLAKNPALVATPNSWSQAFQELLKM